MSTRKSEAPKIALLALAAASSLAVAETGNFSVRALENSTSGGVGLATFDLVAGQQFNVTADAADLWNAGALPRWSNADGLVGNLTYTSGTDAEVPAVANGTLIGQPFPNWSQGGLVAPYGSLVGQIGGGNFFLIGTHFSGTAGASGTLKLFYFDSNNYDNFGQISVTVSAVPLPAAGWLMLSGLAAFGAFGRRRRVVDAGEPVAAA